MSQQPELEEVQENFNMGIICAQQVLAHFADRLNLPEETTLRLASAFGSGMGKGPALSLLLAGPALSLPSMIVLRQIMGTKMMVTYVCIVVVLSTFVGYVFGMM